MAFFGFGKKVKKAAAEVKKFENRDFMEAVVGGSILVAGCDDNITDDELVKLEALIETIPALTGFGNEIHSEVERFAKMIEASFRMGKTQVLREIADVQGNDEEIEDMMNIIMTIAETDGEVDAKERAIIEEIGKAVNFKVVW